MSSRVFLVLPFLSIVLHFYQSCFAWAAPPKLDYLFPAGGQRGTTVEVTAAGTFERWPVQVHVEGEGITVQSSKSRGKLAITIAKDTPPGVYWLRLHDDDGPSVARPFIVGILPEVMEKEPNDDPKKQVLSQTSVVVNGRLDQPGDVDTFALKLTKGQILVASLEAHRTLRSPMDGVLQILSADGFVLEQNNDYNGLDPQIAFTAPKDDTYLVRLFAFPSVPDSTVRFAGKENYVYRLTLTTGPFVEYVYPLSVSRAGPATVELVGWNIPDDLRSFRVSPRTGDDLLSLCDPRIANPFAVRVQTNPTGLKTHATRQAPQMIVMPTTITGRLDRPGDIDVYQFDARKGDKLLFRIEARTLGFPLDPVMRLTDAAGKTLLQSKVGAIGTDPALNYTATADGRYRLEVSDLYRAGSLRHVYQLRAGPIESDFEVKVAADTFTLTAGKPLEIPVTVTRLGGFKEPIDLSVAGLPKTVSVTTDAKSITLRLLDKTGFNGPIRIVATAKSGVTRRARAPIAEFARTTESLWLVVASK